MISYMVGRCKDLNPRAINQRKSKTNFFTNHLLTNNVFELGYPEMTPPSQKLGVGGSSQPAYFNCFEAVCDQKHSRRQFDNHFRDQGGTIG